MDTTRHPEIVMSAEAGKLLGCGRSRLYALRDSDPRFPPRLPGVKAHVWRADDMKAYAEERQLHPRTAAAGRRVKQAEPRPGTHTHNPDWHQTQLRQGRDGPIREGYICRHQLEDGSGSCGKTIFDVLDGLDPHHHIVKGKP